MKGEEYELLAEAIRHVSNARQRHNTLSGRTDLSKAMNTLRELENMHASEQSENEQS